MARIIKVKASVRNGKPVKAHTRVFNKKAYSKAVAKKHFYINKSNKASIKYSELLQKAKNEFSDAIDPLYPAAVKKDRHKMYAAKLKKLEKEITANRNRSRRYSDNANDYFK